MSIRNEPTATGVTTGETILDVPDNFDYYNIAIESASAQTYTITRLVQSGTRYVSFTENIMSGDTSASFYLPSTDKFKVTPSGVDNYSVVIVCRERM